MRFRELTEARSAPLYHIMGYAKTMAVLPLDELEGRWEHDIPGLGRFTGTSMTRNKKLVLGREVRLVFDQQRLQASNRIIPVDGELVFRHTSGYSPLPFSDREGNQYGKDITYSEEFVVGNVKPLHRYLVRIDLRIPNMQRRDEILTGAKAIDLRDTCLEFGQKFNIPINISSEYSKFITDTEERWRREAEEEAA